MRVEAIVTVLLYVTSFEAVSEARRRNRGKHYTSSTYLDSYQYPGLNQNGQDESEFSGDSEDDEETFPDMYYGKDSVYGRNTYGQNAYGRNTFPQGNFYGSRFDFEGSGSNPDNDSEDPEDPEEGSGFGTFTDDEDIFRITTPKAATTTNIFYQQTTSSEATTIEDIYEGSGSGDFDNDDEWPEHSIPKITVPSRAPTTPLSTTPDFEFDEKTTIRTTVTTQTTTRLTTVSTTTTTKSTTTTTTSTTRGWPSSTTTRLWPSSTTRPPLWPTAVPTAWPTAWPTVKPTVTTTTTTSTTTTYRTSRPIFTTQIPSVPPKENVPGSFGPNKEKVPTPLMENRMAIIIAYTASILLLLIFILIVFCMLMRYHKRPPSEVSSDTASSDLPMLKPDAKRYTSGIRRQNSESPPPLPDLNLFDEPPKYSDLSRGGRSGSLRKSKRDLKNTTPPNWL